MITTITLFLVGAILILYFSEKLVESLVETSLGFGVSAFLLSVVFIGFDPENLFLGSVASSEAVSGIALGTVIGAAMVAVALAFGITALVSPMRFESVPHHILLVPAGAPVLLMAVSYDGLISRLDGALLLLGFAAGLGYLIYLSSSGVEITSGGEVAHEIEELSEKKDKGEINRRRSVLLFVISIIAITVGSKLLVNASQDITGWLGMSDTVFGMTILALIVSIEELARELPAAMKGRPDISFGNVVGSVLAFFLFNAGIISLVRPLPVNDQVIYFYLPIACLTVFVVILVIEITRRISRVTGLGLLILYFIFFIGGFY